MSTLANLTEPLPLTGPPLALHAFVVGYEPIREVVSLRGGDPMRFLLEPVTAAAVEYADGWVLLDSGFNLEAVRSPQRRADELTHESYTPVVAPGDALRTGVERAGLDWADLAACAISHAHFDHTGAVPTLPGGAVVVVQRREWQWVADGAGYREFVLPGDLLGAAGRVRLVDGDAVLAPGLTALATHGHTPGHQSFRVDLPGRPIVLACDAADLDANIATRTPCGWTPTPEGATQAQASIDRLADLRAAGVDVWPGHDPHWAPWTAAMRGEAVVVRAL
ncbi:MAG: N-acyl homoserine lactonase family protein [Actinobacteria bacterium]|nr:N-acyl homoserine lactonase family protein [Actinomycetota bacterium]MCG2802467.1 N-acyl homoserine lactonase family protein [Cellulomonas sp.]